MIENHYSKLNNLKWLIVLLLLTSVDTVLFGTNGNRSFLWIPRIMGIMGVGWICMKSICEGKGLKLEKRLFYSLILMLIFFIGSCVYNSISITTALSRFIAIFLGFVISAYISETDFFDSFNVFLYVISIIAIVTEILAYVFPSILTMLPKTINSSGYIFSTFFVGGILLTGNEGSVFIRASSIFWEPGAYAFYLIIGIMYQLFRKNVPNIKQLLVFICCLILTFSTTGYIVLGVIIIGYIVSGKLKNGPQIIKLLVILGAIVLIFVSVFSTNGILYDMVFAKLFNGTSSATTRYSSFFNGIKVGISHPIFGVGTDLDEYMSIYVNTSKYTNGGLSITNTIVAQFASYGFVFGMFFLCGTIRFFKKWSTSFLIWMVLAAAIILSYMGERFFSFLPFVFVFYGLSNDDGGEISEDSCNQFITIR